MYAKGDGHVFGRYYPQNSDDTTVKCMQQSVPSPRGALGGLAPQTQLQALPN